MPDQVECRSSSTYAEEPAAIYWEGQRLEVAEIEKNWRSPEGKHFLVRTSGGLELKLFYSELEDIWHVVPR